MIESDWKKFCERVRDKQTIAQDEVVIKEAIEALHPGASYTCLLYTSPSPRD